MRAPAAKKAEADMEEQTPTKPAPRSGAQSARFRLGALILIVVAAGLIAWLALRDNGSSSSSAKASVTAVSIGQIRNLAASIGHPVFWIGPKPGDTYELTRTLSGSIFIRYLPPGAKVGTQKPYLTVATYPFPGAFAAIQKVAGKGITSFTAPRGGVAEFSKSYPQSVHLAYPSVDYQVEVYAPTPGTARALVASGQVAAFGNLKSGSVGPAPQAKAATLADLQALAASLKHPIYWAGPTSGYTYELTRSASGNVFVRYLPPGVKVGSATPYLTVATYPFPGAFGAIQALAKHKNLQTIKLAGGGLAVRDMSVPTSIHLAFPGSAYQVEVFDPSPASALRVVKSGKVTSIG
jgi:hypothetical protein